MTNRKEGWYWIKFRRPPFHLSNDPRPAYWKVNDYNEKDGYWKADGHTYTDYEFVALCSSPITCPLKVFL